MNPAGGLPVLDVGRCTGCGDCVAVCPADCLAMAGPRPWLPRPADCISCTACELVCPAGAVRVIDPVYPTDRNPRPAGGGASFDGLHPAPA